MITYTNRLNMTPGRVPLVIHVSQYDSDFSLVFNLYSSDGTFTIESGTTAMIRGTKTDGNAYDADATIDINNQTVTVAGHVQMTAAKGMNVYELVLQKSGKDLATANFILAVERAAMDADTIASESILKEINALIDGASTATEAAARAETAAESVSASAAQIETNKTDITGLKLDVDDAKTDLNSQGATLIENYKLTIGNLSDAGTWNQVVANSKYRHFVFQVSGGEDFILRATGRVVLGFLKTYSAPAASGETVDYSSEEGFTQKMIYTNPTLHVVIPSDVRYIVCETYYNDVEAVVTRFSVDGYDYVIPFRNNFMRYLGSMVNKGITRFKDCNGVGYYNFTQDYVSNITDKPKELSTGGILFVLPYSAGGTTYRIIIDSNWDVYAAYTGKAFKKISYSQKDYGVYPSWEIGAIRSGTGEDAASTKRVRTAGYYDVKGGVKITVPAEMKAEVILYDSNIARIISSNFFDSGTHYIYPRYGAAYFRMYGGYTDDRVITDASTGNLYGIEWIDNDDASVWYALGDSITQGYYSYDNAGSDAIAVTVDCWANIAARKSGLRLVNAGVGGSGYVHNGTVLDKLNAKDHVDAMDFTGAECVTLAYGVNDWKYNERLGSMSSLSGDGTIYGNMKYVVEKILSDNPLCKIFVVTPLNSANTTKDYGTKETNWGLGYELSNSGTLEDVFQAEKDIAEYYGLQLIDQTHESCVNRENLLSVLIDGVHPSISCHATIGSEMAAKITFS